jgi:hypothetical protein
MTIEAVTFKPVVFELGNWHLCEAAELLRQPLRDAEMCRKPLASLRKGFDLLLMASGKSSYLSQQFRNEILGGTAHAASANAFFGLWTTTAGTDMDAYHGGTAGEVSGGSYARVSKTNNTTNFAGITGDAAKVNTTAITWTTASANWNGGSVIPQLLVLDGNAGTSGDNGLVWADFTTAKSVLLGDTAQINASSFSWTDE